MYQQTERSQSLMVIHDPIMPRSHTFPRIALLIIASAGRLCRHISKRLVLLGSDASQNLNSHSSPSTLDRPSSITRSRI